MENNTISKINKLGKAGYIVSKIGKIILIIGIIACFAGAIISCFIPSVKVELHSSNSAVVHFDEKINFPEILSLAEDGGTLKIGENPYKLIINGEGQPENVKTIFHLSDVKWFMFGGVISLISVYMVFHFANKLCAYFKECETPFSEESFKGLKNLAWSFVAVIATGLIIETLVNALLLDSFDAIISFDLTSVVLVLCLFMLSYIFKHGAELQTESDETL